MTRKEFRIVAAALKSSRVTDRTDHTHHRVWNAAIDFAAKELATSLSLTNPNFKRDVFLSACGVE